MDIDFAKKTATVAMADGSELTKEHVTKALSKPYGVTDFKPVSAVKKPKKTPKKGGEGAYLVSVSGMT